MTQEFNLNLNEQAVVESILDKTKTLRQDPNSTFYIKDFPDIYGLLQENEIGLIKRFLSLDPRSFGFKGNFLGLVKVPDNLIKVSGQQITRDSEIKTLPLVYVPEPVFKAYQNLNQSLKSVTGRELLIESAFRSPASQAITFFYFLKVRQFDPQKTAKQVAWPGYSEHGFPDKQAVDFITFEGIPDDEYPLRFAQTEEYKWLLKNADNFGFRLSYPENNDQGIMFEPWHWRFEGSNFS